MKYLFIYLFISSLLFSQDYLIKINDFSINENEFIKEYDNSIKVFGLETTINNIIEKQLLLQEATTLNLENKEYKIQKKIDDYKKDNAFKILEIEDKKNEILNFVKNNIDKRLVVDLISVQIKSPFFKKDSLEAQNKLVILKNSYNNNKNIKITKDLSVQNLEIQHFKVPYIIEKNAYEIRNIDETSEIFELDGAYHFLILKEALKHKNNYTLKFLAIDKAEPKSRETINEVYKDLTVNKLTLETVLKKYTFNKSTIQNKGEPYIANYVNMPTDVIKKLEKLNNYGFTEPIDSGTSFIVFQLIDSTAKQISNEELEKDAINEFTQIIFNNEIVKQAKKYVKISENFKSKNQFKFLAENSYKLKDTITFSTVKNLNDSFFEVDEKKIVSLKELILNWNVGVKNLTSNLNFDGYYNNFIKNSINKSYITYAYNNAVVYNPKIKKEFNSFKENLLTTFALDYYYQQSLTDSLTQREYFNLNSKNYIYDKRASGSIYICQDLEMENIILNTLNNKKKLNEIISKYNNKLSAKNKYYLNFYKGIFNLNNELLPKGTLLKKGIQKIKFNNYYYIINFDEILEKTKMNFEDFNKNIDENYKNFYANKKLQEIKNKTKIEINKNKFQLIKQKYGL